MKILESRPARYDWGMALCSLGGLTRVKRHIAEGVTAGDKILDLGCGTGTLAHLLLTRGAQVTGIDVNAGMLAIARRKVPQARYEECDLMQLDSHFEDGSFDLIVSTLVFSELNQAERRFVLDQVHRLLRPAGRCFVGDEVVPTTPLGKLGYHLLRAPLAIITWLLTQNSTSALPTNIDDELQAAGFKVMASTRFMLGTFRLIEARR